MEKNHNPKSCGFLLTIWLKLLIKTGLIVRNSEALNERLRKIDIRN